MSIYRRGIALLSKSKISKVDNSRKVIERLFEALSYWVRRVSKLRGRRLLVSKLLVGNLLGLTRTGLGSRGQGAKGSGRE